MEQNEIRLAIMIDMAAQICLQFGTAQKGYVILWFVKGPP